MTRQEERGRVETFYRVLEVRVEGWLATEEAGQVPCAELYRYLPHLFLLLTRVVLDARVPARERTATLSALKYIVAPFDLIPEGVVGTSGLRDDLVLAAMVVDHLACRGHRDVLVEHWDRAGDPLEASRTILDASERMVGVEICECLREWLPQ